MTISERIKLTRQQKNMSQSELAEQASISTKSLSRYETGASIPPADSLKAIADVLGVSADYLLSDDKVEIKDKDLFKKFEVIQDMNDENKSMIIKFLDLAIRDAKARKAYGSKNYYIAQLLNRRGTILSNSEQFEDSLESYLEGLEACARSLWGGRVAMRLPRRMLIKHQIKLV